MAKTDKKANVISLEVFEQICDYMIDNNRRIIDEGKIPVTISICGDCGIGR